MLLASPEILSRVLEGTVAESGWCVPLVHWHAGEPAGSSSGNTEYMHHGLPKQAKELRVPVADDSAWKSMGSYHIFHEEARRIGGGLSFTSGNEMHHFCCTVG